MRKLVTGMTLGVKPIEKWRWLFSEHEENRNEKVFYHTRVGFLADLLCQLGVAGGEEDVVDGLGVFGIEDDGGEVGVGCPGGGSAG